MYYFLLDTDSASLRNQGEFAGEDERSDELWRTLTYGRTPEGSIAPEGWSRAFSILINGPASDSMDSTPETYDHSSIDVAMSLVEHFMATAEDVIGSGRWLFMTKAGRLGIANLTASVGDLVCVIPGCDIPMVVREQERTLYSSFTPGTTHGSAYLHGYMYGKAIDELNGWRLSLRTFALS
jgi:hypothetical protein